MARRIGTARKAASVRGGGAVPIVLSTVLLIAALPLCAVAAAGMLPAGVAFLIDRSPRRDLARTVAATNLAGVVPPATALLHFEFSFAGALTILREPQNWLIMYGAAAIGWGLHAGMPVLAGMVLEFRARQAEQRLKARAAEIASEWGEG
ncbi:MAG TPA: hypothetical protein VLV50_20570 [Stellaceae bacterium]|nr:hypothetical protein [Stellaceae bacterium]